MEDTLRENGDCWVYTEGKVVLILVLMEDTLRDIVHRDFKEAIKKS